MTNGTTSTKVPEQVLGNLLNRLTEIRRDLADSEKLLQDNFKGANQSYLKSARNLAHYLALRHHDIRSLQQDLAQLGLSSLGRAEAHVMATVDAVLEAIYGIAGQTPSQLSRELNFHEGNELLRQHAEALLGPAPAHRSVRIMATMPSEAASDYQLVRELVKRGMDCMRINCSYDGPEQWIAMAEHLKRARRELGKGCRLSMDLAGPKLRTSPLEPGPEVVKIRPRRDEVGKVIAPARALLVPEGTAPTPIDSGAVTIPIASGALASLHPGDHIDFSDARGARRRFSVTGNVGDRVEVESSHTAYLASGMELCRSGPSVSFLRIGRLPALDRPIVLRAGDEVVLSDSLSVGRGPTLDDYGRMLRPATIGCTIPAVLRDIKSGDRISFDDGKIRGLIKNVDAHEATIEITDAAAKGAKLRGNKGINLPDSDLNIASLTAKDLEDLKVVTAHADMVAMSFVRQPGDIAALQEQLLQLGRPDIGVVLKIETQKAFDNLPYLVFAAMRCAAAGVMIARGDLAVECGFERTAEIQEEILWVSEAAHMPVIWATQVLETLVKTGQPSRAEITDAAMGQRAECVMLNKGEHLCDAIAMLDDIFHRMQEHQVKKSSMLRKLKSW